MKKGQVLGSVTLKLGEEELGKFNLTAAEAVGRLTLGRHFCAYCALWPLNGQV